MQTTPTLMRSDIEELSPQEIADRQGIPCVFCDHQATRRQRIHGAAMPYNSTGYSSTHLVEVLEYLAENGFNVCVFLCEHPDGRMLGAVCRFDALRTPNQEIDPKSL